jgi:hypothetical protein
MWHSGSFAELQCTMLTWFVDAQGVDMGGTDLMYSHESIQRLPTKNHFADYDENDQSRLLEICLQAFRNRFARYIKSVGL